MFPRSRQAIEEGAIENCCDTDLPTSLSPSIPPSSEKDDKPQESSVKSTDASSGVLVLSLPSNARALARKTPFIPAHDLSRGLFFLSQAFIGYLLMLAVM